MASEWRAKHVFAAAVALVFGLALGGLGPRAEIRGLRAQLEQAEEQACERDVGREIATVFQGRPWEGSRPEDPVPVPVPVPVPEGDGGEVPPEPEPEPAPTGPDLDGLDATRDAMEIRQAQARAALEQQAGASEEQMEEIDTIVADMNADLRALATDAVARFREAGGEPSRREVMMFAADTLDVLIGAEERLLETLTPEQQAELGEEALDPLSYVDGAIVDVLAELDR